MSVISNQNQCPSEEKSRNGFSSFQNLISSFGHLRPSDPGPAISGKTRDKCNPMKTSPRVVIAKYSPLTLTAAGAIRMPINAATTPDAGNQIQIGSPHPHRLVVLGPPTRTAVYAPTPMKNAWPKET